MQFPPPTPNKTKKKEKRNNIKKNVGYTTTRLKFLSDYFLFS